MKIKEIATQIRGVSYKPENASENPREDYVPILRAHNIQEDGLNFERLVYVDKSKVKPVQYVKKGDIVVCASSGSLNLVGKAAQSISDYNVAFGAFCKVIRLNDSVDSGYVGHFFHSDYYRDKIMSASEGANINNIRAEHIDDIDIPLPPLAEQRKIASVLDKVSDLISKRRKQLDKLDELVKARFVEMFGDPDKNPMAWEVSPLSKIIIRANNGMARRGNDKEGSIVLRLVELQDGYIDYENPNRIILSETERKRYLLDNGDFLFARVNGNPEYVGRCAVFVNIGEPVYHNDHIIRVRFDENLLNGVFASELLNSKYGKSEIRDKIKTSAGQYTVSQDGIGKIKAIIPPLQLQKDFAAFVHQTDNLKSTIKQSLSKLELLKKSLMQEYFG